MRWLALGILAGCGPSFDTPTEATAPEQLAEVWCLRAEECALGLFESSWEDQDSCIASQTTTWSEQFAPLQELDCSFSPSGAEQVRDTLLEAECGSVWDQDYLLDLDLIYGCGSAAQ